MKPKALLERTPTLIASKPLQEKQIGITGDDRVVPLSCDQSTTHLL